MCAFSRSLRSFESLYVGEILVAPGGAFVLEQGGPPDDSYGAPIELEPRAVCDRLVEGDPIGSVQYVNANRWHAYLKYAVVGDKVSFSNIEGEERRPERGEGAVDSLRVVGIRADKYVEALRRTRMSVKSDGRRGLRSLRQHQQERLADPANGLPRPSFLFFVYAHVCVVPSARGEGQLNRLPQSRACLSASASAAVGRCCRGVASEAVRRRTCASVVTAMRRPATSRARRREGTG